MIADDYRAIREAKQNMERVTDANTGRPPIVGEGILTAGPDGRDIGTPYIRRRWYMRRAREQNERMKR